MSLLAPGQLSHMPQLCRAFGLLIATEMAIPGAVPAEMNLGEKPAFRVEVHALEPWVGKAASAERQHGPYRVRPDGLLFEKRGVCRYLCCRGGERLIVNPVPGASESDVAAYLIATAIPALLWMRGETVLHGAVAVLPGETQAIGLAGVSGSGKSSLLLEIAEAGGSVVAEDSCRVWVEDGRFLAAGLPGLIHCRAAGAALDAERYARQVPLERQMLSAELSRFVVLKAERNAGGHDGTAQEASAVGPVRLHGVSSLAAVLRNRHRPQIPDLLDLSASVLLGCSALARKLPVYSWEFLQAASRSPVEGGTWRTLAGL